jgi:predicted lipid-binding transport protein (Tim44 family)
VQADLILYALVAAGLVFWLRSVLGTRHGDERERPNPFTSPAPEKQAIDAGLKEDVITLPQADPRPVLPRNTSIVSESVERNLMEMSRIDGDFDITNFAQGAQDAFVIIVEAFASGDRDTLKNLLEPSVYNAFDGALKAREESGETMTTEIHSVRRAEILDASIDNKIAAITIRFIADETCVIKNKDGAVISGDPDRITEMNDIWTFVRTLRSRDPRWLVRETRDGDVREDHKTPVPDVH